MLDPNTIFILSFVCITFVTGSLLLVYLRVQANATPEAVSSASRRLRRAMTVYDQPPATSLSGRIDQGFERLVLETGLEITPATAFLMVLAVGLLVGGTLLVIYDVLLTAVIGMSIGMGLLLAWFAWKRHRRMKEIREQLPHVVDLLARGVRAGISLDQAIHLVGEESGGVLGPEFNKASQQLQMGLPVTTVMKSMAARIPLLEMRILASTLMVHRQTGGNLTEALERVAAVIRDRLTYQRQMKASTGAGRTSAILIATITPAVYVLMFLWQPEHFGILLEDPTGRMLLTMAAVLEIVGIIWVIRLLRLD